MPLRIYQRLRLRQLAAGVTEMVCVAGFDPAAPRFQGEYSTRLSYTQIVEAGWHRYPLARYASELARLGGFDPPSTD